MKIERATKKQAKGRMSLIGPSGSGKTLTMLRILCYMAKEAGGRAAVIDSENRSASKYAGDEVDGETLDFDVIELEDFSPLTYVKALNMCAEAGYVAVGVDSLTHAWVGKGGSLEAVDKMVNKGKNQRDAWREVTPQHNALVDALLRTPFHLICTLRTKTEYVTEKDDRGKNVMKKIGLQPIQREGLEYEFDVVADMQLETNRMVIDKTRCRLLKGKDFVMAGADVGKIFYGWLSDGAVAEESAAAVSLPEMPTKDVVFDELNDAMLAAKNIAELQAAVKQATAANKEKRISQPQFDELGKTYMLAKKGLESS